MKSQNIKKLIGISVLLAFVTILTIWGTGTKKTSDEPIKFEGFYFDTIININVLNRDLTKSKPKDNTENTTVSAESNSEDIIQGIENVCYKYENLLSKTIPNSDVWNINHNSGEWVKVDPETAWLVAETKKYCELSNGALDITISPVVDLWDGKVPEQAQIDTALQYVDYREVEVTTDSVRVPQGASIDLGAVAKGFIADKLTQYLEENGVTSAIINLGGNTACVGSKIITSGLYGKNKEEVPFTIGIQKPFSNNGEVIATTPVVNESVVTSGTYQRYFEENGRIYHHILSSSDGYPVDNGLSSVSIRTKSSLMADCLSTACFCLGLDNGMNLIEGLQDAEALFVDNNNVIYPSSGW